VWEQMLSETHVAQWGLHPWASVCLDGEIEGGLETLRGGAGGPS